jgi:hypothetical protein
MIDDDDEESAFVLEESSSPCHIYVGSLYRPYLMLMPQAFLRWAERVAGLCIFISVSLYIVFSNRHRYNDAERRGSNGASRVFDSAHIFMPLCTPQYCMDILLILIKVICYRIRINDNMLFYNR